VGQQTCHQPLGLPPTFALTNAHDLNPIELVWGNLKATELANLCPEHIDEADTAAHTGLHRIGSNYDLCFHFLDHTGLRL
jgi:hypothetical protein